MAMIQNAKPAELLTVTDVAASPVWEFANIDDVGETLVVPVSNLPARDLLGMLIGTQVRLANGTRVWAILGNVDSNDPRTTEHLLTLSIEHRGKWFHLARYHDADYAERGPGALASLLDMQLEDVFPISFDLRKYSRGDPSALMGAIQQEPRERLSRPEIRALAISRVKKK